MRFPPRLGHLATRPVVAAKLRPTYAQTHQIDEEEAEQRLSQALRGPLWEDLLALTWECLQGKTQRLNEEGLLEKVAQALKDRPLRPGRVVEPTPALSAFWVLLDLEAGTASEVARRVLESPEGRKHVQMGLAEAGRFLAGELIRK
jgi:hypothetical protein